MTSILVGAGVAWMLTGDPPGKLFVPSPSPAHSPLSPQLLLSIQIVGRKDRCMQSTATKSKLEQLSEMQSHLVGLHKMHTAFLRVWIKGKGKLCPFSRRQHVTADKVTVGP